MIDYACKILLAAIFFYNLACSQRWGLLVEESSGACGIAITS